MLVSIIINNYNYANFLRQAIDSALQQTHRPIEVIVVDDGSSDGSREIITSYGEAICAVIKENGGQASALNAGFGRSQGEAIIFLDADDMLHPDIAGEVAAAFEASPEAAKVQYRLAVIDASGTRTGLVKPPVDKAMPGGDLRSQVLSFPDDIAWQPTSGNALRDSALEQIMPIPEDIYRLCADYYLLNLSALCGRVISLDKIGGYLRAHGANLHETTEVSAAHSREIITQTCHTHRYIKRFADAAGLDGFPAATTDVPSVTFLAHRMVSLKLERRLHPLESDTLSRLLVGGVRASLGRFDLPRLARFFYLLWFAAATLAPRPAVRWLARKLFYPETRGGLNKLIGYTQRQGPGERGEMQPRHLATKGMNDIF